MSQHDDPGTKLPASGEKLPVESASRGEGAGELELFSALAHADGRHPLRHAARLVRSAPALWGFFPLLAVLYHGLAGFLTANLWVARTTLFPTLLAPISQAVHVGILLLTVGAAVDALRTDRPPGVLETLRRWGRKAAGFGAAFLALRLALEAAGGPVTDLVFRTLPGLFGLLWFGIHVGLELTLEGASARQALTAGGRRAGQRLLRAPRVLAAAVGSGRALAWLSPLALYAAWVAIGLLVLRPLQALFLIPLGVFEGAWMVGMAYLTVLHTLTWMHLEVAARLDERAEASALPEGEGAPASALPPAEA